MKNMILWDLCMHILIHFLELYNLAALEKAAQNPTKCLIYFLLELKGKKGTKLGKDSYL